MGLAARLCQQRMPVEPTAPPAHGESQPAATGWVPDSDKNFSHPSFPLCSALLHSSGLGGCRRTAFPLEQHSWRVVKHKAPVSALHHGRLQQWHSKVFPSSINEVVKSFANIFLEQEALSHPQPQAPFPSPLSQVLTELPSFCHIAGP